MIFISQFLFILFQCTKSGIPNELINTQTVIKKIPTPPPKTPENPKLFYTQQQGQWANYRGHSLILCSNW